MILVRCTVDMWPNRSWLRSNGCSHLFAARLCFSLHWTALDRNVQHVSEELSSNKIRPDPALGPRARPGSAQTSETAHVHDLIILASVDNLWNCRYGGDFLLGSHNVLWNRKQRIGLCNGASCLDCVAWSDLSNMHWKGSERKRSWPVLKVLFRNLPRVNEKKKKSEQFQWGHAVEIWTRGLCIKRANRYPVDGFWYSSFQVMWDINDRSLICAVNVHIKMFNPQNHYVSVYLAHTINFICLFEEETFRAKWSWVANTNLIFPEISH
jgi:hypothetical protein